MNSYKRWAKERNSPELELTQHSLPATPMALGLGDTHQLWGATQVFLRRGMPVLSAVSPNVTGRVRLQEGYTQPLHNQRPKLSIRAPNSGSVRSSSSSARGGPAGRGLGRRSWGLRAWDTPKGMSVFARSPPLSQLLRAVVPGR